MTDNGFVRIVEMAPRDGLQSLGAMVPLATKIELIEKLASSGLTAIEVGAFVSSKWVPQMTDSGAVLQACAQIPTVQEPWVLVPNLKGYHEARLHGATHIAIFAAASESFSQKNTNVTIAESLIRLNEVAMQAKIDGVKLRGYVSCALGCPFEGAINPVAVLHVSETLAAMGCDEISIGDTIGKGTLLTTERLFNTLLKQHPAHTLAAHFHDTYGQALANLTIAVNMGVRTIDASTGGLGGCPYAPRATGNVATEDVLVMLHGAGYETGIDFEKIAAVGAWINKTLGRDNASRAGKALCGLSSSKLPSCGS